MNRKVVNMTLNRAHKQLMKKLGSEFSLKIEECDDGIPAVEAVKASGNSIGIVLMDNIMKKQNGPAAARAMRASGYSGVIVGVTGNVLDSDIREFKDAGADHVLAKPLDEAELVMIVRKVLVNMQA